jgi:hypothetical protein
MQENEPKELDRILALESYRSKKTTGLKSAETSAQESCIAGESNFLHALDFD